MSLSTVTTFYKFLFSFLLLTGVAVPTGVLVWLFGHSEIGANAQIGSGVTCVALMVLFGYMSFKAIKSYFFTKS